MAAPTPVGSLAFEHNSGTGNPASVDVPDGDDADLEVAIGGSNFFDVAGFGPPSGGGWSDPFTVDRGVNDSHLRIWTRTAPAGEHTVSLATIGGEEVFLAIRRLAGADLADPVADVDGATAANGSHASPALDLGEECYLIGAAMSAVFEGGGTYTPPAGFTELEDFDVAGGAFHGTVAEDEAAGPGAVGPFTFAYSQADPGLAAVIAIRPAPTGITGTIAATEAADTAAATGTVTPPAFTGSIAVTEGADTMAAAGTVASPGVSGSIAVTESPDTVAASGTVTPPAFTGTISAAEAADTMVADGDHVPPRSVGNLAVTERPDLMTSSGTAMAPEITGTIAVTEQPDTMLATDIIAAPTPAERTYVVPAESRALVVPAESRTSTIPAEERVLHVV